MSHVTKTRRPPRVGDAPLFKYTLIGLVLVLVAFFIVAPLAVIGIEAFSKGVPFFLETIADPDTGHAIGLTVLTALIAVPLNTIFGVAAAWAITKHDFRGKRILTILIEIPFSVSPVVAGVAYLFVYGLQGIFGPVLDSAGLKILFALPGIVLAFSAIPALTRLTRAGMIQAMGSDYIRTARAKGLSRASILLKHALRNAAIPVVAIAAVQLGFMLGGSIVIEQVFALHGVGYLAWESIGKNDFPVVQAVVLAHLAQMQARPLAASGTRSITAGVKTASKHQQRSGLVLVNLAFSIAQTLGS